eukprot:gnl/Carplike_NY0171/3155_a4240_267.p1 GENE.gnl/Carplike_NY0171/3155_a4240_267~~gnl/Carplike_NY0171/3155_a4240_267.p1  ORF type:complete len:963 (+),score=249.67 gnl/Carplike_NY0171/3155_a4240_267:130-2889(+)
MGELPSSYREELSDVLMARKSPVMRLSHVFSKKQQRQQEKFYIPPEAQEILKPEQRDRTSLQFPKSSGDELHRKSTEYHPIYKTLPNPSSPYSTALHNTDHKKPYDDVALTPSLCLSLSYNAFLNLMRSTHIPHHLSFWLDPGVYDILYKQTFLQRGKAMSYQRFKPLPWTHKIVRKYVRENQFKHKALTMVIKQIQTNPDKDFVVDPHMHDQSDVPTHGSTALDDDTSGRKLSQHPILQDRASSPQYDTGTGFATTKNPHLIEEDALGLSCSVPQSIISEYSTSDTLDGAKDRSMEESTGDTGVHRVQGIFQPHTASPLFDTMKIPSDGTSDSFESGPDHLEHDHGICKSYDVAVDDGEAEDEFFSDDMGYVLCRADTEIAGELDISSDNEKGYESLRERLSQKLKMKPLKSDIPDSRRDIMMESTIGRDKIDICEEETRHVDGGWTDDSEGRIDRVSLPRIHEGKREEDIIPSHIEGKVELFARTPFEKEHNVGDTDIYSSQPNPIRCVISSDSKEEEEDEVRSSEKVIEEEEESGNVDSGADTDDIYDTNETYGPFRRFFCALGVFLLSLLEFIAFDLVSCFSCSSSEDEESDGNPISNEARVRCFRQKQAFQRLIESTQRSDYASFPGSSLEQDVRTQILGNMYAYADVYKYNTIEDDLAVPESSVAIGIPDVAADHVLLGDVCQADVTGGVIHERERRKEEEDEKDEDTEKKALEQAQERHKKHREACALVVSLPFSPALHMSSMLLSLISKKYLFLLLDPLAVLFTERHKEDLLLSQPLKSRFLFFFTHQCRRGVRKGIIACAVRWGKSWRTDKHKVTLNGLEFSCVFACIAVSLIACDECKDDKETSIHDVAKSDSWKRGNAEYPFISHFRILFLDILNAVCKDVSAFPPQLSQTVLLLSTLYNVTHSSELS